MRAHYLISTAAALNAMSACSSSDPPAVAEPVAAAMSAPPSRPRVAACDLVTGAEISTILGGKVVPRNNDHATGTAKARLSCG
jgi:hypothetical protein